jgi:MFS family permease
MAVWFWYFRDSPADHPAVTSADLSELRPRTREETRTIPWLALVRRMWPCTAVNFCYGWTLWLFLTWIPSFFVQNYHLALGSSALYASGVFFGGVVGDTLGGILSDRILRRSGNIVLARRGVIIAGFLGACLFLIPVMLVHDVLVSAASLSLAFFCAELIVAPIWAVPMDIAPRYAGSASGMMNFGSAFAGIVSPLFFGYVIDLTGTWTIPFSASMLLLLLGAALTLFLRPDVPFADHAVPSPLVGARRAA